MSSSMSTVKPLSLGNTSFKKSSTLRAYKADASALYARNVLDFLKLVLPKDKGFTVDMEDDIVAACLMTQGGDVKRK